MSETRKRFVPVDTVEDTPKGVLANLTEVVDKLVELLRGPLLLGHDGEGRAPRALAVSMMAAEGYHSEGDGNTLAVHLTKIGLELGDRSGGILAREATGELPGLELPATIGVVLA